MSRTGTHESSAPVTEVEMGSERSFGFVFAAVFAVVSAWPLLSGAAPRWWALAVAAAFLAAALVAPRALRPLNLLWFRFGMLLHKIVTPLVMGLLFFLTITPIGLLMRMTGKDPMRLKRDAAAASYWIGRTPPGPAPDTMKHQF
ncbi:MAG TPA: SxtJ family membrane protein [Candidatus Omnitrophota bacterium]|nr:SxtJ family membrane protein [Candidatus Omnitrophota bacterium]